MARATDHHLVRHAAEMLLAMMLGMCVLGAVFREIHSALFGTGFVDAWRTHTELAVYAMTFNMTLPMVLWMRHGGHPWERCGEMAAAMFAVALAALVLFWLGVIPGGAALGLEMILMTPAMLLLMFYRVGEYSQPHRASVESSGAQTRAIAR